MSVRCQRLIEVDVRFPRCAVDCKINMLWNIFSCSFVYKYLTHAIYRILGNHHEIWVERCTSWFRASKCTICFSILLQSIRSTCLLWISLSIPGANKASKSLLAWKDFKITFLQNHLHVNSHSSPPSPLPSGLMTAASTFELLPMLSM